MQNHGLGIYIDKIFAEKIPQISHNLLDSNDQSVVLAILSVFATLHSFPLRYYKLINISIILPLNSRFF